MTKSLTPKVINLKQSLKKDYSHTSVEDIHIRYTSETDEVTISYSAESSENNKEYIQSQDNPHVQTAEGILEEVTPTLSNVTYDISDWEDDLLITISLPISDVVYNSLCRCAKRHFEETQSSELFHLEFHYPSKKRQLIRDYELHIATEGYDFEQKINPRKTPQFSYCLTRHIQQYFPQFTHLFSDQTDVKFDYTETDEERVIVINGHYTDVHSFKEQLF
jgi:hypothetical protein